VRNATQAYVRTRNETASKERLMVLLFETALRHIRQAAAYLEKGKSALAEPSLSRASAIVGELAGTLDKRHAPELCENLTGIYLFVSDRLIKARLQRSGVAAREAERAFAPIAEAFAEAVKQVEQTAAGSAR
jgi:flagellar protein FliS